ncbi:RCC1 domain-containing protein [Paludibaculum fermentans]|uniref:Regulator of chromosome condensation RCC1 n=1 Tax=Paludibaculum fermentans TaxID=1473598 RepID=A0A7S7NW63_PALFE|nr:hypothetical protein [Paludibaculum fermentans]QOY90897.1 hypothetical protein IRI77_13405 [Paludibaculum fermentans]
MKLPLTLLLSAVLVAAQSTKVPVKVDGESHKLILFADGTIGGWGDSRDGQLGPRAAIPNSSGHSTAYVPIALPGKARDIAAGARTSYVLLENGTVVAFGAGFDGQLGCGERGLSGSETPVEVAGLTEVARIVARFNSAFAVHRDGSVSMWGGRFLGEGERRIVTPERAVGLPPVTQVALGGGFLMALTPEGRVWMAGKLPFGRIYADDPVQPLAEVPGLTDVAGIVATQVAAVLKKDGTVWVWGNNDQAQFGNGRRDIDERTRVPVRVPGVANVTALCGAMSGRHFLALLKDGTLRTWGNTDWGQAGIGVTGREQATVATPRINGVKAVFAAGNNSLAILPDGSLWIWGNGSPYPGVWPLTRRAPFPVQLQIPEGVVQK